MSSIDPKLFHEFEQGGWQQVANRYNDSWALVTIQSRDALLNAAHVGAGVKVLDVACGPGYVAGAAASRGASAIGIDFSSEMIVEARRRYPEVDFQEGDAEQLSMADDSFDAVVSNFGMLHLAQPEKALSEAYRVLRSNGRLAFTVWDKPEKAIGHGIVLRAIQQHGDLHVPIPAGPPFFRFSDADESMHVIAAAGFRRPAISRIDQVWRLPSADALFDVMYNSSVRNAALLRAQKPEVLGAIREAMRREVETFNNTLAMPAILATAEKP